MPLCATAEKETFQTSSISFGTVVLHSPNPTRSSSGQDFFTPTIINMGTSSGEASFDAVRFASPDLISWCQRHHGTPRLRPSMV